MYVRSDGASGLAGPGLGQSAIVYECHTTLVILDNFRVGDYQIRPHHYDKLMNLKDSVLPLRNSGVPVSLSLMGHTDKSGEEKMNRGLALARALEVKKWFVGVGVPVHGTSGMGEASPLDSGNHPTAFAKNRRVEISVCIRKTVVQPPQPLPGQPA